MKRLCLFAAMLGIYHHLAVGKELWLIGGGERVCSSVDIQYCAEQKRDEAKRLFDARDSLYEKSMQFSQRGFDALSALDHWAGGDSHKNAVLDDLKSKRTALGDKVWLESAWHQQLEGLPVSEDEAQLIDDIFEVRVKNKFGATKKITVAFDLSDESTRQTLNAYFISSQRQATKKQHNKPKLVLLTASSYNVFEYVDYYLDLFSQVGFEPHWLPIEPGFIRAKSCEQLDQARFAMNGAFARAERFPQLAAYQRDMCLHPKKMSALVDSADAIFINGGDQSLTMRSLQRDFGQFTDLAQRLLNRVDSGVPLAGTSAGTAVQSGRRAGDIPMISDGTTYQALRSGALAAEINAPLCPMSQACTLNAISGQLTYRPLGGLQTFTLGVMDTHFYQREREGRLLRLLSDTHTSFGFGVDEGTALRVNFIDDNNADLEVWGADGVWIVDTRNASTTQSSQHWQIDQVYVSRLLAGDKAQFRQGDIKSTICGDEKHLIPDMQIDQNAYANKEGRQWRRESGNAISACQRADGRWRYLRMPISLLQQF